MKIRWIPVACVAGLLFASVATAHEQIVRGRLLLSITNINDNVISFDVNGRVTPLKLVKGNGALTADFTTGKFDGKMTLIDQHGDQLFIVFEGQLDRMFAYKGNFKITGGTGHWIGHVGGGTMNGHFGDANITAFLDGVMDH